MDKQAINKELTELLGECWHEWSINTYSCKKCEACYSTKKSYIADFFTNEGYGKLRDVYDGWDTEYNNKQYKFVAFLTKKEKMVALLASQVLHAFHRDNLAPLMLEFLKGEG